MHFYDLVRYLLKKHLMRFFKAITNNPPKYHLETKFQKMMNPSVDRRRRSPAFSRTSSESSNSMIAQLLQNFPRNRYEITPPPQI